ncbi:MAG: hypothetical protein U0136_06655 [Bdellovibrionota bacterium]
MKIRIIVVLSMVLLCSVTAQAQSLQPYTLPSGKQIRAYSVTKMNLPAGPALVMNYETAVRIEDTENLRKEIDEIWSLLKGDADKAGVKSAVIRATHYETSGIFRRGKGYGFAFTKAADGSWQMADVGKDKK